LFSNGRLPPGRITNNRHPEKGEEELWPTTSSNAKEAFSGNHSFADEDRNPLIRVFEVALPLDCLMNQYLLKILRRGSECISKVT
jgi:hypothetical protein